MEATTIVDRFLPKALKSSIDLGLNRRNYTQFRLILILVMTTIIVGSVVSVAGLGYYYYRDLLQKEEIDQLRWQIDGKVKSIEALINNLTSVVQFTARNDRYGELLTGDNLGDLFVRIKRQYPFFADLGVIDHVGIQQNYWGPYELTGTDYSGEDWFAELSDKGLYISGVYTGYRQVPHFSIAVRNLDPLTGKIWILRATIDASTLQSFINTIKTNASDDLFLVDDESTLQTVSKYYGPLLTRIDFSFTPGVSNVVTRDYKRVFQVTEKVKDSPWSLVLVKQQYFHHEHWQKFSKKLLLTVFICISIGFVVVYILASALTGLIRKAEETQLSMLREAEHTDKLASIGRLAAGVGHEINNPLAIINQKTGLIEDLIQMSESDFEHKETIQNCLQVINQSIDRCKAITHRLLGFARRTDVHPEILQVNDIIKEVLMFLDNSMTYSRININLQLDEHLSPITSDQMQLQQIFLNIINNAIDAIGKNGEITIMTHMVAGDVRVVIQDNGPGIAENILPHIFEPFFTTKETGKGTGLGLSITYGLIKKLGGEITVRSHVGQGTAFTITIPLKSKKP
jgi:two-component system NtrC family sensor kinase